MSDSCRNGAWPRMQSTPPKRSRPRAAWLACLGCVVLGCEATPTGPLSSLRDVDLVGAGDIADCGVGSARTAKLLGRLPGLVITMGDHAYPDGTTDNFRNCYHATWGKHKARTRPTPGNHDYRVPGARGYFGYFGSSAAPPLGYYSFDLDGWHVVAYNSVTDISEDSPQLEWLREDLRASKSKCILAYGYHPRFSSGWHGDEERMAAMWSVFQEFGVDVVLSGHDHHYERFAPLDTDGSVDWSVGIRQFVVGTGGVPLRAVDELREGSEFHLAETPGHRGVIAIDLEPNSYEWEFITVDGGSTADSGTGACR